MAFSWQSLYTNETLQRSAFRTRLRTRIDEDTADFITNEQINNLIEDGLRDIARRTGLTKTYATETADGSASYTLPTDLVKLDEVLYLDSSSRERSLIKANPDEIEANYSTSITEYYTRYGNTIVLKGNPSSGTIKIIGSQTPSLPIDDDSYIDLPFPYIEALFAWCEWKYWTRRRVPDEMELARKLYLELVEQIRQDVDEEYNQGVSMYGKFKE